MTHHKLPAASSAPDIYIRRACKDDAQGVVDILKRIVAEQVHSAIDEVWTTTQEASYLASMSPREALHIATIGKENIVGFQSLDLWSPAFRSMAHVAQIGTFLLPEWRRSGIGKALFEVTKSFAQSADYKKILALVRGSNTAAQVFYHALGFIDCGKLTRQVVMGGQEDDEILMEYFL